MPVSAEVLGQTAQQHSAGNEQRHRAERHEEEHRHETSWVGAVKP